MTEHPDVFLIAENHGVPNHADMEMEIISSLDPEYVVMEDTPSDRDVEELMNQFDQNKTIYDTGKGFAEKYGESFLNSDPEEIYSESMDEIASKVKSTERYNITDGITPDDVEEFISTPVYELHPIILENTYEAVKEAEEGDKNQEDLTELKTAYEHLYKSASTRSALIPRQLRALKSFVDEEELEVVSESNEFIDQDYYHPTFDALTLNRSSDELIEENAKIDEGRERCMGETLAEYAEKSDSPIVGIIGKYHARESTELYPTLESEDVSYHTITLKDNEPFEKSAQKYISEAGIEHISMDEYRRKLAP